MERKLPDHMRGTYGTMRRFKAHKRRQLDCAISVMRAVLYGSAFVPGAQDVGTGTILADMVKLREQWKAKNWGR